MTRESQINGLLAAVDEYQLEVEKGVLIHASLDRLLEKVTFSPVRVHLGELSNSRGPQGPLRMRELLAQIRSNPLGALDLPPESWTT